MSKTTKFLDKLLGNSEEDIKQLEDGLKEIRDLNERLTAKYSLRSDLVELTDQRRTVAKELTIEKDKITQVIAEANVIKEQLLLQLAKFEKFENEIIKIKDLLDAENGEGETYYEQLLSIIDVENIETISTLVEEIKLEHTSLYDVDENNENTIDRIKKIDAEFQDIYNEIFVREIDGLDGEKTTKSNLSHDQFNQLDSFYKKVFVGDEFYGDAGIQKQTEIWNSELNAFYRKIFGDEKQPSLELELDRRLASLKEVEIEAKKVINLSK